MDIPKKIKENLVKIHEVDIKVLQDKGKKLTKADLSSDDDCIFDEAKDDIYTIPKPVVAPKLEKTIIEDELLTLFSAKRIEPEANTLLPSQSEKKKIVTEDPNEYMECYPIAGDYKEIGNDPEFGDKVKEMFQSEEQIKQDERWEKQRRINFLFGGSSAGKKKVKGKSKNDVNRIQKVRLQLFLQFINHAKGKDADEDEENSGSGNEGEI